MKQLYQHHGFVEWSLHPAAAYKSQKKQHAWPAPKGLLTLDGCLILYVTWSKRQSFTYSLLTGHLESIFFLSQRFWSGRGVFCFQSTMKWHLMTDWHSISFIFCHETWSCIQSHHVTSLLFEMIPAYYSTFTAVTFVLNCLPSSYMYLYTVHHFQVWQRI